MITKEKQTISPETEHHWLKFEADCVNEIHDRVRGKLLTTLEVAITNTTQLEALKSRVKDVQAQIWDRIVQNSYSIFAHRFTVSKEIPKEKPLDKKTISEVEFISSVDEFWATLEKMLKIQFSTLKVNVLNLLTIAIDDSSKQVALAKEFERIISDSLLSLQNWLGNGIRRILKGKVE